MALIIDAVILILLVATIGYAFLLERRMRTLMAALRELAPTVSAFSAAVDRTEGSVEQLRAATQETRPRQAGAARVIRRKAQTGDTVKVAAKADLIRSFFDTARETQA